MSAELKAKAAMMDELDLDHPVPIKASERAVNKVHWQYDFLNRRHAYVKKMLDDSIVLASLFAYLRRMNIHAPSLVR